jgi:hypothetical protein
MNKYFPYIIVGVLIMGAVVFVSGRLNTNRSFTNNSQSEEVITDSGPTPIPVSELVLDDELSYQAAIDAELNWIDKELSGIKDSNLDISDLSDEQLGLWY